MFVVQCKMESFYAIILLLLRFGSSEPTDDQLDDWKSTHPTTIATDERGVPMASLTSTLQYQPKFGSSGKQLLFDTFFFNHMAHFNRERIPERVAHAKGGGAFGYFEVLHDITAFTKADIFSRIGKKTPIAARFSTSIGESGISDTIFSPRGIAVKFYTDVGNWDLTVLNIKAFFIRDPMLFPSMVAAINRNTQTHLINPTQRFDFFSLRQEATLALLNLFGPDGHPDGFRHMHGFAIHTFKMINKNNEPVYVKFHLRTNQGLKYLTSEDSETIAGKNPDYSIEDLYNAIAKKNFPSWNLAIQVMTYKQAEKYRWDPFDPTKFWRFEDFPLLEVGRLVLNRNPENYFADVEQMAFDPGNLVPGIEMGPDILLQGRVFSYSDSQRYRLGSNFNQLPVNEAKNHPVNTYSRDGSMCFSNGGGAPKYFPNSYHGPTQDQSVNTTSFFLPQGEANRHDSGDEDNYSLARWYWNKSISHEVQLITIKNLASVLQFVKPKIRQRAVDNFGRVDSDLKHALNNEISKLLKKQK